MKYLNHKTITRRKFLQQSGTVLGGSLLMNNLVSKALAKSFKPNVVDMGSWLYTGNGLPLYQYKGPLPFTAVDKNGVDAVLPQDPFFLLGNYRMALVTHASGIYQFLTAERAWARINASEQPNYGWNEASITFKNDKKAQKIKLTGLDSIAANPVIVQKHFGIGFARYAYQLENGIVCTRILSVKPSVKINSGNPSFIITVQLKKPGGKHRTWRIQKKCWSTMY